MDLYLKHLRCQYFVVIVAVGGSRLCNFCEKYFGSVQSFLCLEKSCRVEDGRWIHDYYLSPE
jgi:hypothetical protein